jgi:putative oxidoreductase
MMITRAINPSWGPTALRLTAGYVFLVHGAQDLFVSGVSGLAGTFGSLHIPVPFASAVAVALLEFIGGIALWLGVFTRWAAALLAIDMLVAVMVVLLEPSFFQKGGVELPLMMLGASIALALSGPGALALTGRTAVTHNTTQSDSRLPSMQRCLRRTHRDAPGAAPTGRAVHGQRSAWN